MKNLFSCLLLISLSLLSVGTSYAAWDKTSPGAGVTLALSNPLLLANFVAIDAVMGTMLGEGDAITSTAVELNLLDGVTSTTAELNILDGVTSTYSELNALDGITSTVTELNYTDGVTSAIQTQLDLKSTIASPTFTGTVTVPALSASANLDIGSYSLTAETLISDVTTGTAPLTISSTTKVSNLNVDQVDGYSYDETELKPIGNPTTGLLKDTPYLAATDGFVCAYSVNAASSTGSISGYTDSSNPPTTLVIRDGLTETGGYGSSGITMPVKKGNYWKLTCSTTVTVSWIPMGN